MNVALLRGLGSDANAQKVAQRLRRQPDGLDTGNASQFFYSIGIERDLLTVLAGEPSYVITNSLEFATIKDQLNLPLPSIFTAKYTCYHRGIRTQDTTLTITLRVDNHHQNILALLVPEDKRYPYHAVIQGITSPRAVIFSFEKGRNGTQMIVGKDDVRVMVKRVLKESFIPSEPNPVVVNTVIVKH